MSSIMVVDKVKQKFESVKIINNVDSSFGLVSTRIPNSVGCIGMASGSMKPYNVGCFGLSKTNPVFIL